MAGAQESLVYAGVMRGHNDVVTAIATPIDNSPFIVSSSRDKSLLVWDLTNPIQATQDSSSEYGVPFRRLTGHGHFVQDVIVSASRDRTIKLWNTLGECKYTIGGDLGGGEGHTGWVSCVRFSPNNFAPTIVSGSWDRSVKVWNLTNCKLRCTLDGHGGYVSAVAVSPDGSLCASGGKDGVTLLWDLTEGKRLYSLDAGSIINSLCFSPNRYWLCAATQDSIKIWDLESKHIVQDLRPEVPVSTKQLTLVAM
ncbi:unnamed protein product [Triticum turgidum subsp. durum]|uniref:Guanine nucleotide-binding protein subunit beta-like protein n=1 Tax=Triticum turgidum subsp. durum TaxID=4567 RepID=A0A9R0RMY8_TRITD|nr:unnamed protein product [Triticum turgidum subsp. durum]VAH78941.1 unnamed protein product [Triticum turgidum subsp. durum]